MCSSLVKLEQQRKEVELHIEYWIKQMRGIKVGNTLVWKWNLKKEEKVHFSGFSKCFWGQMPYILDLFRFLDSKISE